MRIAALAHRPVDQRLRDCVAALDPGAPRDYRELAGLLVTDWLASTPRRVGLGGGQGAGKSTLGRLLEAAGEVVGLRVCVLALDDFYLPRSDRLRLADTIHPLFETRGPPGTHDTAACHAALTGLVERGRCVVPRFDKGIDDRAGVREMEGPFDVVVLEGWCVGAAPSPASESSAPCNALEEFEDADGRWRTSIEQALRERYVPLWSLLDQLVFLRVPDLAAVRRWRLEQELARPAALRLDADAIDRFVQHYERITLRMAAAMPGAADVTVDLATDHSVAAIHYREPRSHASGRRSGTGGE